MLWLAPLSLLLCTESLKIVHIGAGVSNLVTATLLKKQYPSCHVTIYEQGNRCGGRLGSFHLGDQGQYRFDIGPSLLLLKDVYLKTMQEMGLSVQELHVIEKDIFQPVDPFYRVYFEGEEDAYIDLNADKRLLQEQLNTLIVGNPSSSTSTSSLFEEYMDIADAFLDFGLPAVIEEQPLQHLQKFPAFIKSCLKAFPLKSHDKMITDLFKGHLKKGSKNDGKWTALKKIRALLSFQDLYVGLAPSETPAVFSLLQALEFSQGIYYPTGGFQTVTDMLMKAAQKAGVEIYTNTRLRGVTSQGQQVESITLEDCNTSSISSEEVDVLVSNIDVPRFENRYMSHVAVDDAVGSDNNDTSSSSKKDARSSSMRPSCAVLSFHWAFSKRLHFLSHHNIFLCPDLDRSWDTVKYSDRITIDRTKNEGNANNEDSMAAQASKRGAFNGDIFNFYVHAPARTDSTAAPDSGDSITVLVPVPPLPMEMEMEVRKNDGDDDDDESVERRRVAVQTYENQLVDEAKVAVMRRLSHAWQAYDGKNGNEPLASYMQQLRSCMVLERVVTPLEWSDSYNLFRGSAFGLAHSLDQLSILRPAKQHPKLRNVFRVGASTTPGNGVPLCMIGGRLAAEEVTSCLRREKRVK